MAEKSLQEILEARRQSSFVGRASETLDFERNLKLSPDDPLRSFVFTIFGQGGMGKTTLLARCLAAASSAGYATAWSDEDDDDLIEVMARLAGDLAGPQFGELEERTNTAGRDTRSCPIRRRRTTSLG